MTPTGEQYEPVVPDALGGDAWQSRGWTTPPRGLPFVLMLGAALCLFYAVGAVGGLVGQLALERDQGARYVAVDAVRAGVGDRTELHARTERWGELVLPGARTDVHVGERVRVLVDRDDPGYFLPPAEQADPGRAARDVAKWLVGSAGLGVAAWWLQRRRPLDVGPVRDVAARLPATSPPPAPVTRVSWRAASSALWSLPLMLLAAGYAYDAAGTAERRDEIHATATAEGVVAEDEGTGRLELRYSHEDHGTGRRPLTGAERARGLRAGDRVPVTFRPDVARGFEHPAEDWFGAALLGLGGAVLLGLGLTWPRRLRRLLATAPEPVDAVTWSRVSSRGAVWLLVAPEGARRPSDVVAVALPRGLDVPMALVGPLEVHGRLRRGRAAVVRGPEGEVWLPRRRCAGWFRAALDGVAALPPDPPGSPPGTLPPPARVGQLSA